MKLRFLVAFGALTLATASCIFGGEIIDRIVATVNGQIILQSDWDDEIRYEAFAARRAPGAVSAVDRKAALDHLIDQELLREQQRAPEAVEPAQSQIDDQIGELRKEYGAPSSEADWNAILSAHRLTGDELRRRVTRQLELSRVVDLHLRPSAIISSASIENYYRQALLPQLRQSGSGGVSLAEVTPRIRELLTQQKINELLIAWLQTLHAGSEIHTQPYPSSDENVQR
jgi:hypothetical protein